MSQTVPEFIISHQLINFGYINGFKKILKGELQEKLYSKIEKFEALEVVVKKLRKKIHIMILFAEFFSLVENDKLR